MKIALAQMDCELGKIEANLATIAHFAEQAAAQDSVLLFFPEMADIGYDTAVITECATSLDGPVLAGLQQCARTSGVALCGGIAEREADAIYNTQVLIDAQGNLQATYRKAHLFTGDPVREQEHFAAGQERVISTVGDVQLGHMICYDLRFPEFVRSLAVRGAQLLALSSAWPDARSAHWEVMVRSRAIENQCYVVAVNRVGTDHGWHCAGRSAVVAPDGSVVVSATAHDEALLVATIDMDAVRAARKNFSVLSDRRPELYC